mmetsp:Transcript_126765/g.247053  ORF Transcript_126765/g.247053 Transcript_126765/m.247053 type:complete len:141 (+) Transcript_126765:84-506(+)
MPTEQLAPKMKKSERKLQRLQAAADDAEGVLAQRSSFGGRSVRETGAAERAQERVRKLQETARLKEKEAAPLREKEAAAKEQQRKEKKAEGKAQKRAILDAARTAEALKRKAAREAEALERSKKKKGASKSQSSSSSSSS